MREPDAPARSDDAIVDIISAFLHEIGIAARFEPVRSGTFLPGLEIARGELFIDRGTLLYPGDILHEAGHIAVSTPDERSGLSGNVIESDPNKRGEELAVLAWSYAACIELGISANIVFHEGGYRGESSWLLDNFREGRYLGAPLLVWMGLAHRPGRPDGYPRMMRWVRG